MATTRTFGFRGCVTAVLVVGASTVLMQGQIPAPPAFDVYEATIADLQSPIPSGACDEHEHRQPVPAAHQGL